jgi:hypothetical protein
MTAFGVVVDARRCGFPIFSGIVSSVVLALPIASKRDSLRGYRLEKIPCIHGVTVSIPAWFSQAC